MHSLISGFFKIPQFEIKMKQILHSQYHSNLGREKITRKCAKSSDVTVTTNATLSHCSRQWMEPVVRTVLGVSEENVYPTAELQELQVSGMLLVSYISRPNVCPW